MGGRKRKRGGRRAAGQRRAADLFDVASVVEDLVRDVEALWDALSGGDSVDWDRCDRHAFCAAADPFREWNWYGDCSCSERRRCAFCSPAEARGCRACARRRRRHLIRLRRDFASDPADLLRRVAEQRELGEQWGDQYRLPSLCELAPLPGVCCVCSCCRYPDRFAGGVGVHVGCSHQCCRRHMPRVRLQQRCAQFAREIAVAEELDGDWRSDAGQARRASRRRMVDAVGPVGMVVDEEWWVEGDGGGLGWLVDAPPRAEWRDA